MIYYTGDIHGSPLVIEEFCQRYHPTESDVIVILGDVGANYHGFERDDEMKKALQALKPTIFCIHGNHEIRPANIPTYKLKEWCGGQVWYEEDFPSLLFAKDGEVFTMEGIDHLVIGGAYSVDKYYRIPRNMGWWPDEQPSEEIKQYVWQQIREKHVDVVLSHTCPLKYEPLEMFLPGIDQSRVDRSTEQWLDSIEEALAYHAWLCGHWHINKRTHRMHFLFHGFTSSEELKKIISGEIPGDV